MFKVYKKKAGDVTVLFLQGRLVTNETFILRDAALSELNSSAIVLDFARVSRIDARGLGVLLEIREHGESKGLQLKLVNVPRLVRRIFEISHLDSVFEVIAEKDLPSANVQNHSDSGLFTAVR
jgi:anti-anti-sigma factor